MQQFFVDEVLNINDHVKLDDEILYHLQTVLRKDSDYTFRLCDAMGRIFFAHLIDKKSCVISEMSDENNELTNQITCILSLFKNDRYEFCVQKLVELGVSRIVPYQAYRSVVKAKEDKKLNRLKKIVREAACQSHRNRIPEVKEVAGIDDLKDYMSDQNYICYENLRDDSEIETKGDITYVIGPEGGFDPKEYEKIVSYGFLPISLGKRILRAETAAIYLTSVIVSRCQ
ncbi:MAG: 16S rRNA (uracil(1498)-N(3))-methyltransferase [Erysipelotrichaceae bacterium]|nr:16S rRNA (uracil(1498)-N(3))-methyltransferase [Erysipelotrichaceae bacterium]